MDFDFEALASDARYRLLTASVAPRPIAWITSQDADGLVNAAPYSFFNVFSADPPILGLGIGDREAPERDVPKDTKANIRAIGQFVVNLVDEAAGPAMNRTATAFPHGVGEVARFGLETVASVDVMPPRLAISPVSFECVLHQEVPLGPHASVILGRVVRMHVRDDLVQDAGRQHLATERMALLGRMHGGGTYARTTDLFRIDRIPLDGA